jgi:hypothetical protein
MEIARVLGWYRVPLRTAPKVISVDYLAFYQPASFGERKWGIEYVAPVRGHELVSRAELLQDEPDHPRAREEYFKIQLGPLVRLPEPIRAERWKRITFFYTTGDYLLEAETINDLIVHSDERQSLWKALRERADQMDAYTSDEIPSFDVDPTLLAVLLGVREFEDGYDVKGGDDHGEE